MLYTLMHRDVRVMNLDIDEYSNITALGEIFHKEHLPLGTYNKIGVERKSLNAWWTRRSIPASRQGIREVLEELELSSPQELINKCFGLSLSDQYWVSPIDQPLDWHRINFFENDFSEDIGNLLFGKGQVTDSVSLFSPDNTANGNLKKKWKIIDGKRVLIKSASAPYHQEAYNEVIASMIAERLGIDHVPYRILREHGEVCCGCEDFINSETDLVPAAAVTKAFKKRNEVSDYEFYIDCCERLGIKNIRMQMEKMLVLDYLIVNEDRHLNNFGLIRNAVTLEWLKAAPVYDCGNSLWFNRIVSQIRPDQVKDMKTPLWKKNPVNNLELIRDYAWLDLSRLDGIEHDICSLLESSEYMEPPRIHALCSAIRQQIEQLDEIAHSHHPDVGEADKAQKIGKTEIQPPHMTM